MGFLDQIKSGVAQVRSFVSGVTGGTVSNANLTDSTEWRAFGQTSAELTSPTLAVKDNFFDWAALDARDYNKSYQYQLVIADGETPIKEFTLPVSPQSISISVPNTTTTTVTMNGILEEHNGAPLRQIRISGTTGILTSDTYQNTAGGSSGLLSSIAKELLAPFGNTIKAGLKVVDQAVKLVETVTGSKAPSSGPLNYTDKEMFGDATSKVPFPKIQSGYHYIHNLTRFLDLYIALKKNNANKAYRLVFQMEKDQMYYYVTLNNYSIDKTAGTLEYSYNINMTAWRRRKDKVGSGERKVVTRFSPTTIDRVSILAGLVNGIQAARGTIASFKDMENAVRSDADELKQTAREIGMFVAEVSNLPRTAEDIWAAAGGFAIKGLVDSFAAARGDQAARDKLEEQLKRTTYVDAPLSQENNYEANTTAPAAAWNPESTAPANNLTTNPDDYTAQLLGIAASSMVLPANVQAQVDAEYARVLALTANDFRTRRDFIAGFSASMAESFGAGSASYNRTVGLPAPKTSYREPSIDDILYLNSLNDLAIAADAVINLLDSVEADTAGYFDFYRDYALSNGLSFTDATSKFFVPFPHGSTLEALSLAYLGDQDRWMEIAALNGLKSPYIDEEGSELLLSSTGSANSLIIPTSENLYVGQVIEVISDLQPASKRHIVSIDIVNAIETILIVDGAADLVQYKASQNARIRMFKPHTVNSSMLIAIPSQSPSPLQDSIKINPGVEDLNGLAKIAGVDFLLQSDGDMVFSSGGDIMLARGLTNIVQAAQLKMQTKLGSLLQHPDFGNPIDVGMSTADVSVNDVATAFDNMFKQDARFKGINMLNLVKSGPGIEARMLVSLANSASNFALSTQLPL